MTPEESEKLTLAQAVANLAAHRLEWQTILQFMAEERERCMGDLRNDASPSDVMKTAGTIAAITELRSLFTPEGWS